MVLIALIVALLRSTYYPLRQLYFLCFFTTKQAIWRTINYLPLNRWTRIWAKMALAKFSREMQHRPRPRLGPVLTRPWMALLFRPFPSQFHVISTGLSTIRSDAKLSLLLWTSPAFSTIPFIILLGEHGLTKQRQFTASITWPVYKGRICLPITTSETTCTLGGYPSYVVNVSTVAQIQLVLHFADENGLRLVVKNTRHDYLGKSVGKSLCSTLYIWRKPLRVQESNERSLRWTDDYRDVQNRHEPRRRYRPRSDWYGHRSAASPGCQVESQLWFMNYD